MTKEDLAELARATEELRLKQETPDPPEALATVPGLSLDDIPKEPIIVPIDVSHFQHCVYKWYAILKFSWYVLWYC